MTEAVEATGPLARQLCRILEDTAFMLVENAEAPLPEPALAIQASLAFGGKANGICWLVVTEQDARQLATEMLGATHTTEGTSSVCDNATAELLNILTAWFLDEWWGDDVEHTLGIPETRRLLLPETRVWTAPDTARVVISTDSGCTFMSCITLE